jgi:hypothetical protein
VKYRTSPRRVGGLGELYLSEFYRRTHGRLPGSPRTKRLRRKRLAVIVRWWNSLPEPEQEKLEAEAQERISRIRESVALRAS